MGEPRTPSPLYLRQASEADMMGGWLAAEGARARDSGYARIDLHGMSLSIRNNISRGSKEVGKGPQGSG